MPWLRQTLIGFLLIVSACVDKQTVSNKEFSFFVAGHTYGSPGVNNKGLHPPFENAIPFLNGIDDLEFGILTGDIVYESSTKNWDQVDSVLRSIKCFSYFAPGNHDLTDLNLYRSRYEETYYSFYHRNNLFLVLDPNQNGWNIDGAQLQYFRKAIEDMPNKTKNIFVFSHQLIWWTPTNEFSKLKLNSLEGRAEEVNFWNIVEPLLSGSGKDIYYFAGDVGAFATGDEIVYHKKGKNTFIASGMGGNKNDNLVITRVSPFGKVSFDLISLNGESKQRLGKVEDHKLK